MNPYDARVGLGTAMKAAAWDEGYEAGAAAKQAEIVKLLREHHGGNLSSDLTRLDANRAADFVERTFLNGEGSDE